MAKDHDLIMNIGMSFVFSILFHAIPYNLIKIIGFFLEFLCYILKKLDHNFRVYPLLNRCITFHYFIMNSPQKSLYSQTEALKIYLEELRELGKGLKDTNEEAM